MVWQIPQALDLDTLVYRAVYENIKPQEICEETEQQTEEETEQQ